MNPATTSPTAQQGPQAVPPRGPWHRLLYAVVSLVVIGAAVILAVPSFNGWFVDDDVTNMRWVLEYRDTPLAALLERHSVHDHIRPLSLISHWLGAQISNGAWWGPHLVLVVLYLAGFIGAMTLARTLTRAPAAGWLAGLLALSFSGLGLLLTWNAWIGSAGEIAFGLWSLVAVTQALRGGRVGWLLVAAACVTSSGLFKEPGWLVYPLAAAVMAWISRGWGARGPVPVLATAMPLLGALGFALCWHPANLERYSSSGANVAHELVQNLHHAVAGWIAGWPFSSTTAGIAAPLLALALWSGLLEIGGWTWIAAGLGTAALWGLEPRSQALTLFPLMGAVIVRQWRNPPVELVMTLASVGVMLPNPGLDPVHVLAGAYGLAIFVAGRIVVVSRRLVPLAGAPGANASRRQTTAESPSAGASWRRTLGGALLAAVVLWQAGLAAIAAKQPAPPRLDAGVRDRVSGMAGIAEVLRPADVRTERIDERTPPGEARVLEAYSALAPLFKRPKPRIDDSMPPLVARSDEAVYTVPAVEAGRLSELNRLSPREIQRALTLPVEIGVPPGLYALALTRGQTNAGLGGRVVVSDRCRRHWRVAAPESGEWASLMLLRLEAACGPLTLRMEGTQGQSIQPLLLGLPAPTYDLRGAHVPVPERRLDVRPRSIKPPLEARPQGRPLEATPPRRGRPLEAAPPRPDLPPTHPAPDTPPSP